MTVETMRAQTYGDMDGRLTNVSTKILIRIDYFEFY